MQNGLKPIDIVRIQMFTRRGKLPLLVQEGCLAASDNVQLLNR